MISKSRIKFIHSLEKKKFRLENGLFVAEGPKLVEELMAVWNPVYLAATQQWFEKMGDSWPDTEVDVISEEELAKASLQKTPQQVLALFRLPQYKASLREVASHSLCLALDGVQDPGNIGTIIRLADWFGIEHVFCSMDTADIFAPKAIQATMGAICRVEVHYTDLVKELKETRAPIYGTHLDGENMYEKELKSNGVIVMGNEGKGVSPEVEALTTSRLYIPPYPTDRQKVESLNVAIATAIVCAEFRRR